MININFHIEINIWLRNIWRIDFLLSYAVYVLIVIYSILLILNWKTNIKREATYVAQKISENDRKILKFSIDIILRLTSSIWRIEKHFFWLIEIMSLLSN